MFQSIDRRCFLQSLGISVALPAMHSLGAEGGSVEPGERLATTASGAPMRMAFVYVPNGVNVQRWRPGGDGADYTLNHTMQPLEPYKQEFQVFSGFEHRNGTAGGDGGGDHARANASFLTGVRPKKTAGSDIRLGISVDQFAAQQIRKLTRFPSLELSCDGVRTSGSCDSGYSCAYQYNLAWRSETSPVAPESNPRLVFERLFGSGNAEQRAASFRRRQAERRSILDFITDDAQQLSQQLGRNDQQKLDEYLTGVREIEQRIQRSEQFGLPATPDTPVPEGIPRSYAEHLRLMYDMMVLAFQTDSTRIATFLNAYDGSNRTFNDIGVTDGHHTLSHHQDDDKKLEKIARIDLFYVEQFAYFLGKMREVKDADGQSLLENSMIVYASGLSDGNRHRHNDLPVILAGHGGGLLNPGVHRNLGKDTPLSNLFLTMIHYMGIDADSFADSTSTLESA